MNGDFLLSASRDSILVDHPWNKKLLFEHLAHHIAWVTGYTLQQHYGDIHHAIDPLQFVPIQSPTSNFFQQVHQIIEAELKSKKIVPVYGRKARELGTKCTIIPGSFVNVISTDLPDSVRMVDPLKYQKYNKQIDTLGAQQTNKQFLETVIQSQIPADLSPEWFCELYIFMAKSGFWKPSFTGRGGSLPAVTQLRVLLLQDKTLMAFGTPVHLPIFKQRSAQTLLTWCNISTLHELTLPKDDEARKAVQDWFYACKIRPVDVESMIKSACESLHTGDYSGDAVLEATRTIMHTKESRHLYQDCLQLLPLVSANGGVVKRPCSLPVVHRSEGNGKFLELFKESDDITGYFYLMHPMYSEFSDFERKQIFSCTSLPPLPSIFSWMKGNHTEIPYDFPQLLLALIASQPVTPGQEFSIPAEIKQFLSIAKWVPTTKGRVSPDMAYLPTPELIEVFGDSVPFVLQEIYNNGTKRKGEKIVWILIGYCRYASRYPQKIHTHHENSYCRSSAPSTGPAQARQSARFYCGPPITTFSSPKIHPQ